MLVDKPIKTIDEEFSVMSQHGDDTELSHFSLAEISKSTEDFSKDKKLGQGGFGPVYMGVLDDGRKIAVKKLLKTSRQGVYEFKNELQFIAKLQHRNLVKLLGYCNEGDERMLIYEHMPNKSLDYLIFDKIRSLTLDWSDRFHIIHGIVRGLLYLHHDSRFKIVHRDLKASNILGYMSPEYAVNGTFSEKSDVFSFGVLELEIVSGKTNRGFSREEKDEDNLLAHAWRLYEEGMALDLLSEHMRESCVESEVLRSILLAEIIFKSYAKSNLLIIP
ncbi:putative protein kinase RLK-Pelle-DLSV family [Helianthus annuus]|uniref:non-specific serine/threonine protein kinase n=1 Tax=Helianthus annuus TaxID=4232 RepID=A0A9K3IM57_HELAN|nr:putative protein kinase RLK-Pelle-DLSV family [Helianthus annuus]KAJ0550469.1 putative protein kinase RLK-Pelle-DLSV family [Helianthus annuus]KAJ0557216.1 putative protein kinase RLK-Pelle-DLSV family [Helianthus annuus]KAJ0563427.1 putative protein kinase RLK-Pelle-DLSV family [Helianthus annuus]KAJ0728764.1 putative protein kinase RLK-Pelle-DLSV family [Helianthus annuus]